MGRWATVPWARVLRATWDEFCDDKASIVASGVAFRVALAMFPAITLLVWIGTRILGPDEAQVLAKSLAGFVPDSAAAILKDAVASSHRQDPVDRTGAGLLGGFAPLAGILFTLWSTNGGMWALFDALNVVYDETEQRSTVRIIAVTLGFTAITLVLFALVTGLLVLAPAILQRAGLGEATLVLAQTARWGLALVAIAVSLSLLFRYAPCRQKRDWPFVTVGSVVGAILLVLASALYSFVMDRVADLAATYGALSTTVSFLLWLWLSFVIVLAAAELDSCIESESGLYGGGGRR